MQGHGSAINGGTVSPDGNTFLTFAKDHTLRLWRTSDGLPIAELRGHSEEVLKAKFSHDGKKIASAGQDKTLRIWDARNASELMTLNGHKQYVIDCDFSPDDQLLVSSSADNTVKLWNVNTGSELTTFTGHNFFVTRCSFSPSGSQILSASMDDTVKIWDVTANGEDAVRYTQGTCVNHCEFSADGLSVASVAKGDGLRLWNVQTLESTLVADINDMISNDFGRDMFSCHFVLNERAILTGSIAGVVTMWDITNKKRIAEFYEPDTVGAYGHLSPDGTTLFKTSTGWRSGVRIFERPSFTLWDVNSGKQIAAFGLNFDDDDGGRAFSDDASLIATARWGCYDVKVWDGKSGRLLRQITLDINAVVKGCALSPNNQTLAVASDDHSVRLWRIPDGELFFRGLHAAPATWCGFSPDGERLISADESGVIKVWECTLGLEVLSIAAHAAPVTKITFSPDGKFIYSRSGHEGIKIWNLETGDWVGEYRSESRITTVALDRRWQRLAVGTKGGEFDLLDVMNFSLGPAIATTWKDAQQSYGYACPICTRWHEVSDSSLGNEVNCPSCDSIIRLNRFFLNAEWKHIQVSNDSQLRS